MPKAWDEMTIEEKLEELHQGRQSVVLGLARIIEEICAVVQRLEDEFAEFRRTMDAQSDKHRWE
jgi:predicted nuclease of restriction endonuclease-like RecB superfamily